MTDQILIAHELPAVRRLINAARADALAYAAQQNPEMAALLRDDAARLERRLFAQRPIGYTPTPDLPAVLDSRMEDA